mmetsp:Transcript_54985/g.128569  ORF Transcript_54985/g.128569 Transcript_54985/m.128569 type:complete len:128 (+) Transcript_54985:108-491(+)
MKELLCLLGLLLCQVPLRGYALSVSVQRVGSLHRPDAASSEKASTPQAFLQGLFSGHKCDATAPGWTRCHLPTTARYSHFPRALGAFSLIGFGSLLLAVFAGLVCVFGGFDMTSMLDASQSKRGDAN